MDDLEQQIKAWADAAAPPTDASVAADDVIAPPTDASVAADDVIAGRVPPTAAPPADGSSHGGRGRWLAVAAVVMVVGAIGITLAVQADDDPVQRIHASDPPVATTTDPQTSVPVDPSEVRFEELGVRPSQLPIGQLKSAQSATDLARLWREAGKKTPLPAVDFDEQVVVAMTIADDACPPTLTAFVRNAEIVEPRFVEPQDVCEQPLVARTFVAALDWSTTGDHFLLVVRDPDSEGGDASIEVTRDTAADEGGKGKDESDGAEGGDPAPGVTAALDMDATAVPVGGTLTGTVTVVNNSGGPVEGTTCGGYFVGTLHNDEYQQGVARLDCLGSFTIPEGTSTYPIEVQAAVNGCTPVEVADRDLGPVCNADGSMPPMPAGEYQLTIDDPLHLVPAIDPVTITVT
jgi:hypothetical protein